MRTEDDLRMELSSLPPAFDLGTSADELLARGRRRRRAGRTALTAGAVALAAVAGLGVVRAGSLGTTEQEPMPGAGGPAAPGLAATAAPDVTADGTADVRGRQAIGAVVRTGEPLLTGERVLWVAPVDEPALPDVEFGVVEGVLDTATGRISQATLANEVQGSSDSPGFHATQLVQDGTAAWRLFGYFVGDAARVSVVVDGRRVEAGTSRWSEDSGVVLWWASGASTSDRPVIAGPTAYSADGKELPAGRKGVSVG
ncbi:hypothetical protein [Motilibacter aurantiacus]|uniref:hypothetical protein n=1 Tax=Motilibacter aurantiacus TaxID=2714955 RepID=UPI001407837D|nr:hypothetical protein [Motilibacter aurantiacus]NHC45695.1 hypothetical protein [Motilibacter aurantiacus]